ncbi:MAG: tetratricopeptide repeat protein [Coprococcus sp.]
MSTGISMSSVNKIKELADNGDYSLALDILEHQDLSKSLSPQFIRICGEVYYENKRYPEARAALVKAHAMAPAGNKIIYSLIKLYLSMGFTQLAEHYFEIYTFNQANKDAGTYRLEYMIAKAHRKPVNELYSILVSANDVETDEEWDFEMLLLHAYIRNREKFDSACVEFRAHYKNSSHLYMLDKLMGGDVDLESMIYCYPDTEMSDDDPEQADTRANENKILEEDDLRMHPKDAKIMIMVEDDAPVTSSMKFKQMWIRSKDKKEQKKEARQEEENSEPKKKSRGLFGLMSRKEEELVEQEMESLKNENLDKEQLLEEVISDTADDAGNTAKPELKAMSSDSEKAPEGKSQDMTEISGELTPEDAAVYNKDNDNEYEDSEPVEEDNYVIEEEPEEVVMVEVDGDDSDDVSDSASDRDSEDDTVVETFDPEFEGDFEDGFEADAEPETLPDEPVESETFDFDKAFESLEEFEVDDENLEDLMEDAESQNDVEETAVEPGVEQNEPEVDEVSVEIEPEIEEEFEVDADSEPEFEEELEVGAEFTIEAEPETEEELTVEAEPEVEEEFTIDAEAEIEDEFETEAEPELEEYTIDAESEMEEVPVEVESEVKEFEAEAELEIEETEAEAESEVEEEFTMEAEDKSEEKIAMETEPEKPKNNGFPVFKSSLFPDYNTENAALYDLSAEKDINAEIEADEAKISESLKKEEDLIGETDRLLARLGIKFNTEFNSILNFDDEDKEDDVAAPDEEKTDEQESPQQETVDAEPEQPKKKPFRLKG